MAQPTQTGAPSLEHLRQQEREDAVDFVLADMKRFLPADIEPMTWAAMRDYMVTQLGQFQTFDKLLLRNASIEILIRDATDRLLQLQQHANDLQAALSEGGSAKEAFLKMHSFRRDEALRQNVALKARMVVCDTEFVTLRTQNQSLEQSLKDCKETLQRIAEQRDEFRKMIQQRDHELEGERVLNRQLDEECARTKSVLERIEAERNAANTNLNHFYRHVTHLEGRLRAPENAHQASERSENHLLTTRPQQAPAAAVRGLPGSTAMDTCIRDQMRRLEPTMNQTTKFGVKEPIRLGFGAPFAERFEPHEVKEGKSAENSAKGKTVNNSLGGDTSVQKLGSPVIKPCVPLVPPKSTLRAGSPKKQERDAPSSSQEADNSARE